MIEARNDKKTFDDVALFEDIFEDKYLLPDFFERSFLSQSCSIVITHGVLKSFVLVCDRNQNGPEAVVSQSL
jgi:hypothetical protein